jgi:hypothetical protein
LDLGLGWLEVPVLAGTLVYCFHCPGCGEPVPLPHQSPLGISEGLLYVAAGVWPIQFLCARFVRVYEVHQFTIHLGTQAVWDRLSSTAPLWSIACECALEGCGRRRTVYTTFLRGSESAFVSRMLLKANPSVACSGGHPTKFREGHLTAYRLD